MLRLGPWQPNALLVGSAGIGPGLCKLTVCYDDLGFLEYVREVRRGFNLHYGSHCERKQRDRSSGES